MKKLTSYHREYSFEEWQNLPFEIKRDIWNNYWNPYEPEVGQLTRTAIIAEFKRVYTEIGEKAVAIGYGYFGWEVGCIYVVVRKSSIRIPKEFASVMVNKGIIVKYLEKETVLVNWKYGGSNATSKLNTK
jgi:hypothetical protein